MSAQKGVLHTRANSEERSQNPVVTSQNPESGGWRLEPVLPLDLNQHQQRPQCFRRSRDPDVRFNRKHPHVILSHARQRLWPRTPSLTTRTRPTGPTGQVRTGQNRARQGRAGLFRHITLEGLLASSWVAGRSKKTCHWSRLPYLQYFFSLLCTHRPQYAGLASGNSSSKWCRIRHNSQTYSVHSSGSLPTSIFHVTRPTFERRTLQPRRRSSKHSTRIRGNGRSRPNISTARRRTTTEGRCAKGYRSG